MLPAGPSFLSSEHGPTLPQNHQALILYFKHQITDKVQKVNNSNPDTPSSDPYITAK